MKQSCGNCKFWKRINAIKDGYEVGECFGIPDSCIPEDKYDTTSKHGKKCPVWQKGTK